MIERNQGRRRNRQTHESTDRFEFTNAIRSRLDKSPHAAFDSPMGRISVLYGRKRREGEPRFYTIFYRIEPSVGAVYEQAILAGSREAAISCMNPGVSTYLREHEKRQRQTRREAQQVRREARELGISQQGVVFKERRKNRADSF